MALYSIFGASGFVGRHLTRHLEGQGEDVATPDLRQGVPEGHCGHAIYCIGLTADFRRRPLDTMRAHVCVLADVLERCAFDSLLYLSSTRVYAGAESGAEEAKLRTDPNAPGDLYNLSKLAGESLCLAQTNPAVRVARLSNIFCADREVLARSSDFLPSLIQAAVRDGRICLETAPDSTKDFVAMSDAVRALHKIAGGGTHRLYNVASGRNVSHGEIVGALQDLTGCDVEVSPGAPRTIFPTIDVSRLGSEFAPPDRPWAPTSVLEEIDRLVAAIGLPDRAPAGALT